MLTLYTCFTTMENLEPWILSQEICTANIGCIEKISLTMREQLQREGLVISLFGVIKEHTHISSEFGS